MHEIIRSTFSQCISNRNSKITVKSTTTEKSLQMRKHGIWWWKQYKSTPLTRNKLKMVESFAWTLPLVWVTPSHSTGPHKFSPRLSWHWWNSHRSTDTNRCQRSAVLFSLSCRSNDFPIHRDFPRCCCSNCHSDGRRPPPRCYHCHLRYLCHHYLPIDHHLSDTSRYRDMCSSAHCYCCAIRLNANLIRWSTLARKQVENKT